MNLILWVEGSSAAIPFGTLVAILAMWFGISVPLTFVGAYFGFKKPVSQIFFLDKNIDKYLTLWYVVSNHLFFSALCRR